MHLRQRTTHPVRLEDFALVHGLHALMDPQSNLFQRFKQHSKVRYDEKTDLWSYKVRRPSHAARLRGALARRHYRAFAVQVLPPFSPQFYVGSGWNASRGAA